MADDGVNGAATTVRTGFFPFVRGDRVEVKDAGAVAIISKGDLSLTQGGAQMIRAGGDLNIREGGGQTLLARGDVSIREGGFLFGAARSIRVEKGWVGVAVGLDVDLEDSRILLGPVQAAAFGAAAGVALALVTRLLGRSGR